MSCWLLDRDEPARARSPLGGCDGVHAIGTGGGGGHVGESRKRGAENVAAAAARRVQLSLYGSGTYARARALLFFSRPRQEGGRGGRNGTNGTRAGVGRHGTARRARDPVVVTPELTPLAQTSPSASPPPDRPAPGPPFARFAERRIFFLPFFVSFLYLGGPTMSPARAREGGVLVRDSELLLLLLLL